MHIFRSLVLLTLACFAATPAPALADGKVFHRAEAVVQIPDQEALICWSGGVQTLAIETRFVAPGAPPRPPGPASPAEFAWVVPVPGVGPSGSGPPEVVAATPGLFPTLRAIFQPRVVHDEGNLYVVLVGIALWVLLFALMRGHTRKYLLLATGAVILAGGILLPSLGTARGLGSDAPSGLKVLDRRVVGSYDVAIVGGGDAPSGDAIAGWLNASGFVVPPGVEPVLHDYASRGWVFVAAKLLGDPADAPGGVVTPHPLAIRFATPEPVYPLRLTGVGNRDLSVDLYVFGPGAAAADGFEAVRCSRPGFPEDGDAGLEEPVRSHDGRISIVHRGLRTMVERPPASAPLVATKLSGTLTPERMGSDALIRWAEPRELGGSIHSERGAAQLGMNWGGALFLVCVVGVLSVAAIKNRPNEWIGRRAIWSAGLGAVAATAIFIATPKTAIVTTGRPAWWMDARHHDVARRLLAEAEAAGARPDASSLRTRAGALWREELGRHSDTPVPRHEDSPGNYTLRQEADGSVSYLMFDARGREVFVH